MGGIIIFKKFTDLSLLIFIGFVVALALSGCGGGENAAVTGEVIPASVNTTIIADSVKVEKTADGVNISYKTSVPVAKSSVVTSDFAFNNAPLWSEFHSAKSADKLNHSVKIAKAASVKSFMIFNTPSDKYDNNGKGIKID